MKRIDAIREIVNEVQDSNALLIANIGIPCKELYSLCDMPNNFYMLGSMGLSSSIGLGLALSQAERKVVSIDGDGSVLMNMGTLATIASQAPSNYLLVIVDNGAYGSTGNQPTATSMATDLAQVAKAAGNKDVFEVNDPEALRKILEKQDHGIIVVKVVPGNENVPVIKMCPDEIIGRFMAEVSRPSQ